MVLQSLRRMGSHRSKEANAHAALPRLFSPSNFMTIVDDRRQYKTQVAVHRLFVGKNNFMTSRRENCCQIGRMDARHILINLAHAFDQTRGPAEAAETRPKTSNNRIFVDESISTLQIRNNNAHRSPKKMDKSK